MSARSMLRPVAVALPFVLASGLLAGCTSTKTSGAGGSEVQLVEQGKLTVCTHLPYPPFQFKKSGKIVGFDVDMMDLVAKKLKADQKIVDTPFGGHPVRRRPQRQQVRRGRRRHDHHRRTQEEPGLLRPRTSRPRRP